MINKFTVNEKEYKAKAFDFNTVCDLEDMGISMEEATTKPLKMTRAYFAICSGLDSEKAGKEIEAHIIAGNTLETVSSAMAKELEKSDFFRALGKNS